MTGDSTQVVFGATIDPAAYKAATPAGTTATHCSNSNDITAAVVDRLHADYVAALQQLAQQHGVTLEVC
jgi:hypothetical protein